LDVPYEWAKGTIRFSKGKMTTLDEINDAVNIIESAVLSFPAFKRYSTKKY